MSTAFSRAAVVPFILAAALVPQIAFAQAAQRALFVSNNGNLEGSVTSFLINADGTLAFVNRVITGSRPNTTVPCAGCNAYEISITPNGQYLATGHPSGDLDGITILKVAADASISQVTQISLPVGLGTPLDVAWLDNEYLAATRTDTSPDRIVIYRFNPAVPSLTEINSYPTASNSLGYLVVHPSGQYLYSNDSSGTDLVQAWQVGPGGTLTANGSQSVAPPFPLELAITRDGRHIYAAGGISNGGNKVSGLNVANDGTLTLIPGTPFVSPGASPSNVYADDAGKFLFVGHGTDATVRVMEINPATGALTATAFSFDVGLQGTLGDVAARVGLMFVTDNSTAIDGIMGIYSFTVGDDGSLTMNGSGIVSTQGIAPRSIATWIPRLKGDMNCDGIITNADIPGFIQALVDPAAYTANNPNCDITLADMNDSGVPDGDDVQPFVIILPGF